MYKQFVPMLNPIHDPHKSTTIRYGGNKIRLPARYTVALYETDPDDKDYMEQIGFLEIPTVEVKELSQLTDVVGMNEPHGILHFGRNAARR